MVTLDFNSKAKRPAAASPLVPRTFCGDPSDWAMSDVSEHSRWSKTVVGELRIYVQESERQYRDKNI